MFEINGDLRLLPLGGLGEIGLNMMVLETRDDLILIDAGLMFPEDDMLGVDYVIQETDYIVQRREKLRAIVLTHGHEDHIGALPYLLREIDCPIYGTAFTIGFVKGKLEEHGLAQKADLRKFKAGDVVRIGGLTVEPIRVTHSIVDCVGLAIRTPAGLVVHTGDFKIDATPVDDMAIDLNRFATLGKEGVRLLMSDSTNVEHGGYTLSEREVGRAFEDIFRESHGRIIIATFASNIHRLQQALDVAHKFHRKVVLVGKSMIENTRIARDLGYMRIPTGILVELSDLSNLYPEQVCMITTGSQGEPRSALIRMAFGDHKQVQITQGDTIVLSSKFIPGNEKAIMNIINRLYKCGAEVHYTTVSEIHVSGHAAREELSLMLQLTKPEFFLPVHGETRHLIKHARLAQTLGIPEENTIVAHDGDVVEFDKDGGRKTGRVPVGRVLVDGKGVGDVGEIVLRDRRSLSENGMVIAILVVRAPTGEIVYGPDVSTRGLTFEEESPELIEEARQSVAKTIEELPVQVKSDLNELKAEVHKVLRRFFNKKLDRRPVILPVVIEI